MSDEDFTILSIHKPDLVVRKANESHQIVFRFDVLGAPDMEDNYNRLMRPRWINVTISGDKANQLAVQTVTIVGWAILADGSEGVTKRYKSYGSKDGRNVPRWMHDLFSSRKYHTLLQLWVQL